MKTKNSVRGYFSRKTTYLKSALPIAAALIGFTTTAQAVTPYSSPYILNGSSTPNNQVVIGSGTNDVVTTNTGTYNPSSAFADTGSNTSVTIGNGTSITVTGVTPSNGAITLTSGSVKNSGSVIDTGSSQTGVLILTGSGSVTNSSNALIQSSNHGVFLVTGGNVTNSGTISGLGGDGVYYQTGTGTVTNNVGGLISGNAHAIEMFVGGTVTNAGTISGSGSDGVFSKNGFVTVTNNTGALISGNTHGLDLEAGATVTNSGSITGIYVNNGVGTITNNSTGTIASFSYNTSIELDKGGSVSNAGTITNGIIMLNAGGPGSVTNLAGGLIDSANNSYAVDLLAGGSIVNSGNIGTTGTTTQIGVFTSQGTGSFTNLAGGVVHGTQMGVDLNFGGILTNYGQITGDSQAGARVAGGTVTNEAGGVINGNINGVQIDQSSGTVVNAGTITSQHEYGVRGAAVVLNYGTITSMENALGGGNAAYNAVFLNGTYNSLNGVLNAQGLYYALQFTGSNNTANIGNGTRFNGDTVADMFGGGASNEVLNFNFLGGAAPVETGTPNNGTLTAQGVTYTYQGFTAVNVSSSTFSSLGVTPNEKAIGAGLDNAINALGSSPTLPANLVTLQTALTNVYYNNPSNIAPLLDQLSTAKFAIFNSQTAFNNASFETQAMDGYFSDLRGTDGYFFAKSGDIDSSRLAITDSSYDSSLANVRNRLVAWNPGTPSDGLLSDSASSMFAGVDMKDTKSVSAPAYNDPWNFFVRGSVILAQGASQPGVPYFSDNTESVVLGTDYRINPNFLVGISAGYAHTDATLDHIGSTTSVDSYSPGIYASYADHGWYANFSGDYIYNTYSQSRSVAFLGQMAQSSPTGNEGVVNLDGGYDFHSGAMTFGPLAGLQYTHLTVNSYSETGSAADLNVAQNDSDSLRSRLGGTFKYDFKCHGTVITPHIDASWQHEFLDQSRGVTSQFGFGGGSFTVNTPNPSRESALVDAGVNADINRSVNVFVDYIAQVGQDNYFGQSVQAGVKIGF